MHIIKYICMFSKIYNSYIYIYIYIYILSLFLVYYNYNVCLLYTFILCRQYLDSLYHIIYIYSSYLDDHMEAIWDNGERMGIWRIQSMRTRFSQDSSTPSRSQGRPCPSYWGSDVQSNLDSPFCFQPVCFLSDAMHLAHTKGYTRNNEKSNGTCWHINIQQLYAAIHNIYLKFG